MDSEKPYTYVLRMTVRNRPGVMVRCAQVISRRGQNIESLNMNVLDDKPDLCYMVLAAKGKPSTIHQIVEQLEKMVDVIAVN